MGYRLSKIYTRTGDDGYTSVEPGKRLPKNGLRIEALGMLDELNCALGLILACDPSQVEIKNWLIQIQHELFNLGGELCPPHYVRITDEKVVGLEGWLDKLNETLPPLEEFILPGGNPAAAQQKIIAVANKMIEEKTFEYEVKKDAFRENSEDEKVHAEWKMIETEYHGWQHARDKAENEVKHLEHLREEKVKLSPEEKEVEDVFAFEGTKAAEITEQLKVIALLQKNSEFNPSKDTLPLLEESLEGILESESKEELDFYQASFEHALETIKLPHVLGVDSCIEALERSAFLFQQELNDQAWEHSKTAIDSFMEEAKTLAAEFEREIKKNEQELTNIVKTQPLDNSRILQIQDLNKKYKEGLNRINNQVTHVNRTGELMEKFYHAKNKEQCHELREALSTAIGDLREISVRVNFNHFPQQCKKTVRELCQVRSGYLENENTTGKFLKDLVGGLGLVASVAVTNLPVSPLTWQAATPTNLPWNYAGLGASTVLFSADLKERLNQAKTMQREASPPHEASWGSKLWSGLKKVGTFVLGLAGLATSILACATVVAAPIGVTIAVNSLAMMGSVLGGYDYFAEKLKEKERINKVKAKIEDFEKRHFDIDAKQAQQRAQASRMSMNEKHPELKQSDGEVKQHEKGEVKYVYHEEKHVERARTSVVSINDGIERKQEKMPQPVPPKAQPLSPEAKIDFYLMGSRPIPMVRASALVHAKELPAKLRADAQKLPDGPLRTGIELHANKIDKFFEDNKNEPHLTEPHQKELQALLNDCKKLISQSHEPDVKKEEVVQKEEKKSSLPPAPHP